MSAPVTVTRLNVTSDRCYKGLHYIEGAPFRISFWTLATDIDPAEGVRRLRFADDLVAAWNTRQQAEAASNAQIAELREALENLANAARATPRFASPMLLTEADKTLARAKAASDA